MSNKRKRAANPLIQPIDTGSILSDPNNDTHLIGKAPVSGPLYDGLVVISSFIRQHQFLSAGNNVGASASAVSVQDYIKIINEFQDFMQTRQITGLRSNTSSASAVELQKIQDCHRDALQHGLNFVATQDTWFDNTNFHAIHTKLCPDDAQSGRFRNNKVRASNTLFTRPENIQEQFNRLSIAIKRYQTKWASFPSAMMDEKQWVNHVFCQISLVAIVLFGIVDIHPYRDGNGRTARIYMNIALKRILGLPFPVTVTGNVEQRKEYVDALRECRSRLLRISKGENLKDGQSVFQHLIEVVMDRILHHVVEINSLIEAKAQSAAAEDEARILRRWREKAATAQCCICLDNNPNVTTICCGQPVHMNCMAEWLSNQGTCITCRKAIPRMALRSLNSTTNANAANADVPNVGNNIDTETTEDAEDVDSTTEDDTTDETTEDDNGAQQNDYETAEDTTDETTEDDTTSDDDNNAQQDGDDTTEDSTTEDDTTDDTESVQPAVQPRSRFCGHCQRNKFAVDCSNEFCGRCCQLYGSSHCVRHNC